MAKKKFKIQPEKIEVNYKSIEPERLIDLSQPDIVGKKAENLIGARNYDAVVNVNGGDDYVDIQSAIDAGKTNIFIRKGTYLITSQINITSNNISLTGENKADTILKIPDSNTSSYNLIKLGDGSTQYTNINIFNLGFDGNRANQTDATILLYIDKIQDVQIVNCDFKNAEDTGIYVDQDVSKFFIQACYFSNNKLRGIYFLGDDGWISNCYFYNVAGSTTAAIECSTSATSLTITSNHIVNGIDGIKLSALQYFIIANNVIRNLDNNGINIDSAVSNIAYSVIEGNRISICQYHGIYANNLTYSVISNNVFRNNGLETNNAYSNIILDNTSTYNSINGNVMLEQLTNKTKYGIREEHTNCDYNLISNNIVQGAVTENISIQGANTVVGDNIS